MEPGESPEMIDGHFLSLKRLISDASDVGLLLDVAGLDGHSGEKLLGILQRCARYQDECNNGDYLEIGVYKGLSLVSVASVLKNSQAIGIDNFSQFDPKQENRNIVNGHVSRKNLGNLQLLNMDYEEALENLGEHLNGRKIATYFIDGPHDYRSQLICLNLIKPHLAEHAAIIIDDCNYEHVRLANRDFLVVNPEFKLLFEAYTSSHPGNMSEEDHESCRRGWWNGVNIIAKDADDLLDTRFPPTTRSRNLYENEHVVHTHRYAELVPRALSLLDLLSPLKLKELVKTLAKIKRELNTSNSRYRDRYPNMNTHSKSLPEYQFNPSLENLGK